jgi:catechol 2,3-dioxygenase-like lactoylglutathione lyase family enzyme
MIRIRSGELGGAIPDCHWRPDAPAPIQRSTGPTMSEPSIERSELAVLQIALNTLDLPGTLRFYSELFGFVNGGSNAFWGQPMRVQGLDETARGLIWWLVGRDRGFQLEIFQHTVPRQRKLPDDWRPCDHGWVRYGIAISNFDLARATLARWGIGEIAPVMVVAGLRRVAFRDPFIGIVVELMEDGPTVPGGIRARRDNLDPAAIYATTSVYDLTSARHFYSDTLGMRIEPLDVVHDEACEAIWGLGDARREGFAVRAGQRFIEVIQYTNPAGRARRADYQISDQGIMNVGIGCRDPSAIRRLIQTVKTAGLRVTEVFGDDSGLASYILSPERELELIALPEAAESFWGFHPATPFLG